MPPDPLCLSLTFRQGRQIWFNWSHQPARRMLGRSVFQPHGVVPRRRRLLHVHRVLERPTTRR